MPTWPGSLPQHQFIGTTREDRDAVVRTEMDAGPPTRRNRYTAISTKIEAVIMLRGDQLSDFEAWYRNDLKNGALDFDWTDPATDQTATFAFQKPPKWTLEKGGSTDDRLWSAILELEIQP